MATIASPYKFSLMDGNLRLAAILHNEISLLLADRASLRNHESIVNYGDIAGSGSETIRVPCWASTGMTSWPAPTRRPRPVPRPR